MFSLMQETFFQVFNLKNSCTPIESNTTTSEFLKFGISLMLGPLSYYLHTNFLAYVA